MKIISFDLETTGTSTTKDKIVQISAILIDEHFGILEKKNILINPGIPIPEEATAVHHITNEMVSDKPSFQKVSKSLFEYFNGAILAGYNIKKFDIPMLVEEFAKCGIEFFVPKNMILDGYLIFANKEPRTLGGAMKFYCGYEQIQVEESGLHDAENDNVATIEVLESQSFIYGFNNAIEATKFCTELLEKDKSVDFDGKVVLDEQGFACYSFGKDKGKRIKEFPGFGQWMLNQDFSSNTKNVIKSIITCK